MKNYKKIMATLLATTTFFSTNMGGVYAADDDIDSSTTYATESIKGDVNADGEFNVADVVLLQKWLLAVPDVELKNWKAADLCEDDELDVFDLCLMKRHLINMYPSIPVERPLLTIVSYDEYEKYVSENKLNEKIVTYNDIKHFGDFKNFVVLSDSTSGDYSKVMYSLIDESGYNVYITISENGKDNVNGNVIPVEEINISDMRTTKSTDISGSFTVNEKTYNYSGNRLNTITWAEGKYIFKLSGASMLYDYPADADTYTSKLIFIS